MGDLAELLGIELGILEELAAEESQIELRKIVRTKLSALQSVGDIDKLNAIMIKLLAIPELKTIPLFIAADIGNEEAVEFLLDRGGEVNQAIVGGATPLYVASQNGHVAVAKLLLDRGAAVNQVMTDGMTPLYVASQEGHVEVVKILLGSGAAVNQARETSGVTPLHIASQNGDIETVTLLLDYGAAVNQVVRDGATPLFIASHCGHEAVAKLLLDRGALANQSRVDGATPLHVASHNGHVGVTIYLIRGGAIRNARNDFGNTAFHIAASPEVFNALVDGLNQEELQVALSIRNNDRNTPIEFAVIHNKSYLALSPVARSAIDNFGNTVFHFAATTFHFGGGRNSLEAFHALAKGLTTEELQTELHTRNIFGQTPEMNLLNDRLSEVLVSCFSRGIKPPETRLGKKAYFDATRESRDLAKVAAFHLPQRIDNFFIKLFRIVTRRNMINPGLHDIVSYYNRNRRGDEKPINPNTIIKFQELNRELSDITGDLTASKITHIIMMNSQILKDILTLNSTFLNSKKEGGFLNTSSLNVSSFFSFDTPNFLSNIVEDHKKRSEVKDVIFNFVVKNSKSNIVKYPTTRASAHEGQDIAASATMGAGSELSSSVTTPSRLVSMESFVHAEGAAFGVVGVPSPDMMPKLAIQNKLVIRDREAEK